jgi:acyl dehydratase
VRFSDLTPGLVVRSQPRRVTQTEMLEFASRYDPQWFHVDAVRARAGRNRTQRMSRSCSFNHRTVLVSSFENSAEASTIRTSCANSDVGHRG